MTTASPDLCKELYELSGWKDTEAFVNEYSGRLKVSGDMFTGGEVPAYDLGYLLRKLPETYKGNSLELGEVDQKWLIGYSGYEHFDGLERSASTPEDAACKLSIELFRQGVLKRAKAGEK